MKIICCFILLINIFSETTAQSLVTRSIKDFGAKGNGISDDHDAFLKAATFFNRRKGKGKLIIPKGIYIVGRQTSHAAENNNTNAYSWEDVLSFKDCSDFSIQGNTGAVLKYRDSMHIGTFYPSTGKPFKHTIKDIFNKPEYFKYGANAGRLMNFTGCSNIKIVNLSLDGNIPGFVFGGNWGIGRNPYELIHYGIYITDSHDVTISNCNVKNFCCDGIAIANMGQQLKTYKITIDKCKVNYCGRNALSWIGGENIRVSNSEFSNSAKGIVSESPGAGISIEVENSSFCRNGYFFRCKMENNNGSGITSGSSLLADKVLFKECTAASPDYYTVYISASRHIFENCNIYGTTLVSYGAELGENAIRFTGCSFDENYKGKKMYDATYLFGAEATGVELDRCTFKSYTASSYYINAHTTDCDIANKKKISISNCTFYNYCKEGFKLGLKTAGIARYSVLYNNKFYAWPAVNYFNGFTNNCNADGGKNIFYPITKNN